MVFDQKQQIHTLQKSSERMGKQMARSSHGTWGGASYHPETELVYNKDISFNSHHLRGREGWRGK